MADKSVLVVDDEEQIQSLFSEALGRHGYTVVGVLDGESAIQYLEVNKPKAIFLDLRLPGADGVQTLQRIRQLHPKVPVVIITGYPRDSLVDGAIKLDAFACLVKPFSMADALAILETVELQGAV